jgi:hypothetical protein
VKCVGVDLSVPWARFTPNVQTLEWKIDEEWAHFAEVLDKVDLFFPKSLSSVEILFENYTPDNVVNAYVDPLFSKLKASLPRIEKLFVGKKNRIISGEFIRSRRAGHQTTYAQKMEALLAEFSKEN